MKSVLQTNTNKENSPFAQLSDDIIRTILWYATRTRYVTHLKQHFNLKPAEILLGYRLVSKKFKAIIDIDSGPNGKNMFGLQAATEVQMNMHLHQNHQLLPDDLQVIEEITTTITQQLDPKKYIFISLGNSPGPITTAMLLRDPNVCVTELPLGNVPVTMNPMLIWENPSERKAICDYFDIVLDGLIPMMQDGKMHLAIIDYVVSGVSLRIAFEWLSYYLVDQFDLVAAHIDSFFVKLPTKDKINYLLQEKDFIVETGMYDDKSGEWAITPESLFDKNGKFVIESTDKAYKSLLCALTQLPGKLRTEAIIYIQQRIVMFGLISPDHDDYEPMIDPLSENNLLYPIPIAAHNIVKFKLSDNEIRVQFNAMLKGKVYKNTYGLTLFNSKDVDTICDGNFTTTPTPEGYLRLCHQLRGIANLK